MLTTWDDTAPPVELSVRQRELAFYEAASRPYRRHSSPALHQKSAIRLAALSIDLFAQIHSKIISSRIRREERKSMKTFTSTCSPWHDTTSDETIKIESLQVKGGEGKTWRAFFIAHFRFFGEGRESPILPFFYPFCTIFVPLYDFESSCNRRLHFANSNRQSDDLHVSEKCGYKSWQVNPVDRINFRKIFLASRRCTIWFFWCVGRLFIKHNDQRVHYSFQKNEEN